MSQLPTSPLDRQLLERAYNFNFTDTKQIRDLINSLQLKDYVDAREFGVSTSTERDADGRLVAQNHLRLQNAIDYAYAMKIRFVYVTAGTYLFDRPFFMKDDVVLVGDGPATVLQPTLEFPEAANGAGFFDRVQLGYFGYFQQIDFGAAEKSNYSGATETIVSGLVIESLTVSGTTGTLQLAAGSNLANVKVGQMAEVSGLAGEGLNATYNINSVNDGADQITIRVPSGTANETGLSASLVVKRSLVVISLADTGSGNIIDAGSNLATLADEDDAPLFSVGDIVAIRSDFATPVPAIGGFQGSDILEFRKVVAKDGATLIFDRAFTRNVPKYNRSVNGIAGDNKSFLFRMGVCSYNGTAAGETNYGDAFSSTVYSVKNSGMMDLKITSPNGFAMARTAAYDCKFINLFIEDVNSAFILNGMSFCDFQGIRIENCHDRILESAEGCHDNNYRRIVAVRRGIRSYAAKIAPMIALRDRDTLADSLFINAEYGTYDDIPDQPSQNPSSTTSSFKNVVPGLKLNGEKATVTNCGFEGFIKGVFVTINKSGNQVLGNRFVSYADPTGANDVGTGLVIINDSLKATFAFDLADTSPDNGEVYLNNSDPASLTSMRISRYDGDGNDLQSNLDALAIGDTFTIAQSDSNGSQVFELSFAIDAISYNAGGYYIITPDTDSIEWTGSLEESLDALCTVSQIVSKSNFVSKNVFDLRPTSGLGSTAFMRTDGDGNTITDNDWIISASNNKWVSTGSQNKLVTNHFYGADPDIATTTLRARNHMVGNVSPSNPDYEVLSSARIKAASVLAASSNYTNIYSVGDPLSILAGTSHILHGDSNLLAGRTLSALDGNNLLVGVGSAALGKQSITAGTGNVTGGELTDTGETVSGFTGPSTLVASGTISGSAGDAIIVSASTTSYIVLGTIESIDGSNIVLNQDITGYTANVGDAIFTASPTFVTQCFAMGTGLRAYRASSFTVGRWNDPDGEGSTTRFAVGVGADNANRKTGMYVDDSEAVFNLPVRALRGQTVETATAVTVLDNDCGKLMQFTANGNTTVTLPNAVQTGTWVVIFNDLASGTLTIAASGTLKSIGTTVAANGYCVAQKINANTWVAYGDLS